MDAATPALVGNEELRAQLLALADADHLHPCLLFEGPQGVGKHSSARWLAMATNCEAGPPTASMFGGLNPDRRPCGTCWSCRQIAQGQHPDVIEVGLDPEKTAPIISVRQAREIIAALQLKPFQARRRFVIIDPADAMGAEPANALLKTFEEPPNETGFILVTHVSSKLLPTVRSRSQRIRWAPLPADRMRAWIAERGLSDVDALVNLSEGCPGAALALAEGELEQFVEARDALVAALDAPVGERFKWAESLVKGDRAAWMPRVDRVLDVLGSLVRDATALGAGAPLRYHTLAPELVRSWSRRLSPAGAERIRLAIARTREDLAQYVNPRLMLDTLLAVVVEELGPAPAGGAR